MNAPVLTDPFRPQPPKGLQVGATLSLLVHGALVALFAALVWRSAPPRAVVAELWSALPQQAAPDLAQPEAEPPLPTPPPPAPPQPMPQTVPAPPAAAKPEQPTPREADIALKKAREAKEAERKEKAEKAEKAEKERLERERLNQEKAAKEKAAKEKAAKEKVAQDKAEREKAEKAEKAKAEKAERERRERAEKQAEKLAEQRAEKMRQENLARMQGLAGASGGPESSGSAAQSSGPSAGYAGRIRARIKPLIIYADTGSGNPVAEVEVRLSPTGSIIGTRLLRRSGVAEWDAAVLRAVEKAEVLPRDTDGRVPPVMVLVFSPRE